MKLFIKNKVSKLYEYLSNNNYKIQYIILKNMNRNLSQIHNLV